MVFEMLDRLGVLQGRDPRATSFTMNSEVTRIAEHPEWLIPRTDPERFKKAADEILRDAGVSVLFHTQITDVVSRAGRIEAVMVSNKAGLVAIAPKVVIDCTGDGAGAGDVAAWAGATGRTTSWGWRPTCRARMRSA
jgi:FAD dependent oxidoreductase